MAAEVSAFLRSVGGRVFLEIKASPNASRTAIVGVQDGRVRIRVAAAPEDGKANAEIRSFLSKIAACPKSSVELVSGEKSKLKVFSFPIECADKLRAALPDK